MSWKKLTLLVLSAMLLSLIPACEDKPTEPDPPPPPKYGEVEVLAPLNTTIYLDGRQRGKITRLAVPLHIYRVPAGSHKIKATLPFHADWIDTIMVRENATTNVYPSLQSNVGTLEIGSEPSGAVIWLNNRSYNVTPRTIPNLIIGDYELKLRLSNHADWIDSIEVLRDTTVTVHAQLRYAIGGLEITSEPSGAEIWLSGDNTGLLTPALIDSLLAGTYQLKLALAEHQPITQTVEVVAFDTVKVHIDMLHTRGSISVNSDPQGASITLDDQPTGYVTPHLFNDVLSGKHAVSLSLEGYLTWADQVLVEANKTTAIITQLTSVFGKLKVSSTPSGAGIWLDNNFTGQYTPYTLANLTPGQHQLRLSYQGYQDTAQTVLITSGQTTEIEIVLQPAPTSLEIISHPSNATIYLNGDNTGYRTPYTFSDIQPDDYQVRLHLSRYFPVDSLFRAEMGQYNRLEVDFVSAPNVVFAFTVGDTIFVANLDGIITDTLALDYDDYLAGYRSYSGDIEYSPNRQYLAYTGDNYVVSIIEHDGDWVEGFGGNRSQDFAWSPGSDELTYGYYCGGLYQYRLPEKWYGKITGGCYDHSPAYSPDGQKIMFLRNNWGKKAWLYTINTDGSGGRRIYGEFRTGFDEDINLHWLTDSTAVFKIGGKGIYEVVVPDSGSVAVTQVIADGIGSIRLSPDKKWCAYTNSNSLFVVRTGEWNPTGLGFYSGLYDYAIMNSGQYLALRTSDGVHWRDLYGNDYHIIVYPEAGRGAIDLKTK